MILTHKVLKHVDDISPELWQQLSVGDKKHATPFLSYPFLKGLEQSQCIGPKSGWISNHIGIFAETSESDSILVAFIPCYLKTHSYGEYVFDHAWANAYQHHQIPYYPKLVCCIPFTPVTGARMVINSSIDIQETVIFDWLKNNVERITSNTEIDSPASSLHLLFVPKQHSEALSGENLLQRLSVQFVWRNSCLPNGDTQGMKQESTDLLQIQAEPPLSAATQLESFDHYLEKMTSRKRRSIRKERAAVRKHSSSLQIKRFVKGDITHEIMQDFYLCYQQTYLKRSGHTGYLNQTFFHYLLEHMRDNLLIVMAFEDNKCIASALFFYNNDLLAGRYWGALEEVNGLHFECCYYQGIEFCIERHIDTFNPGTQGEHKILRGFEPTYCYSHHYLAHPDFQNAVSNFLKDERIGIENYKKQAESVLPFKSSD
jgi:predicted N-acyltransferase